MLRMLVALCGALVAMNVTQARSQTPLEPRYVQILGVVLQNDWRLLFEKGKFECHKQQSKSIVVNRYISTEPLAGVMVAATRPDSPAEQAELRCGDMILTANGKPVTGAKELQSIIYPLAAESEVTLSVRRAVPGPTDADARITVSYEQPVEMKLKATTLDRVKELTEKLPVRTRELIDEPYGPLVNFLSTTTFREDTPGHVQYRCSFAHRGEQEILPVESPVFFMVGITGVTDLKKLEERTITLDASIAEQGIPTLTRLPVYIATRIATDGNSMTAFFKANKHGSVGVIEGLESPEKNWYHWKRTEIACFLPEMLSRQIEAKIKRFQYIGFGR